MLTTKPIVSADSHVTEHPDTYRRFVATGDREDAPHVERNDSGGDKIGRASCRERVYVLV